jgi:hypothetical protein
MRFVVASVVAALLLLAPNSLLACKCKEPDAQSSLDNNENVFRGTAIRSLKSSNVETEAKFVVQVGKVFKGCKLNAGERVVVTTGIDRSNCGVGLSLGANFVFSASAPTPVTPADNLGNRTKITAVYTVNACNYNRDWKLVPDEDRKIFRTHQNVCKPFACTTGADCPSNHYCDTDICVSYDAKCPEGIMTPICADNPCLWSKPCTEAKCIPSMCSGCQPVFIDPTGTRVCHK